MSHPQWLQDFVDRIAESMNSFESPMELGCHVFRGTAALPEEWEVTVFGEGLAGQNRLTEFAAEFVMSVDVLKLAEVFDSVEACRWQTKSMGDADDLGAHLSVEGTVNDRPVWLRVLGQKPVALSTEAVWSEASRN